MRVIRDIDDFLGMTEGDLFFMAIPSTDGQRTSDLLKIVQIRLEDDSIKITCHSVAGAKGECEIRFPMSLTNRYRGES